MNIKDRWALADLVSEKLGISKKEVFCGLTKLQDAGLVDRILNDDLDAMIEARKMEWYGHTPKKEIQLSVEPEPVEHDPLVLAIANVLESFKRWWHSGE